VGPLGGVHAAFAELALSERNAADLGPGGVGGNSRREGPYASACFDHRDQDGRLTGIRMRGPDYRGFSRGAAKILFHLPGRRSLSAVSVRGLVVPEAPIDERLAANEHLHADTLYVADGRSAPYVGFAT
jgi:hypothetical protein